MSAIDKLKNGSGVISFDTTTPVNTSKTVKAGESIDINMVDGKEDNVAVEDQSNEMNLGNLRRGNHQVVMPKEQSGQRSVASINNIGSPVAPDEDIHVSPEHDMLDIENPDSIFSKYVTQKDAEAAEWIAEKEEEKREEEREKPQNAKNRLKKSLRRN